MAPLLFTCPTTHRRAPTRIETDPNSLAAAWKKTLKVECPHCGQVHRISVREAYITFAVQDGTDPIVVDRPPGVLPRPPEDSSRASQQRTSLPTKKTPPDELSGVVSAEGSRAQAAEVVRRRRSTIAALRPAGVSALFVNTHIPRAPLRPAQDHPATRQRHYPFIHNPRAEDYFAFALAAGGQAETHALIS